MLHVLIVEDESKVANFIKKGLEEHGYLTTIASDGFLGLKIAFINKFDFIILDINLPKINGLEVCKQLREKDIQTPIIFLTASGSMNHKIEGFQSGADDYLVKPFDFDEDQEKIWPWIGKIFVLQRRNNLDYTEKIIP